MFVSPVLFLLTFDFSRNSYTERRRTNNACSVEVDGCAFSQTYPDQNHFPLTLGSSCSLNFESCRVGKCYGIIDWTYNLKWAYVDNIQQSIFANFSISNADHVRISPTGILFRPTSSFVQINFTVHSCEDFYRMHPYEPIEDCSSAIANISSPIRGSQFC